MQLVLEVAYGPTRCRVIVRNLPISITRKGGSGGGASPEGRGWTIFEGDGGATIPRPAAYRDAVVKGNMARSLHPAQITRRMKGAHSLPPGAVGNTEGIDPRGRHAGADGRRSSEIIDPHVNVGVALRRDSRRDGVAKGRDPLGDWVEATGGTGEWPRTARF